MDLLDEPVLVLNKNWQYIAVFPARDALSAVFTDAASAIDPETYAIYTFEDWIERGIQPGKPFLHGAKLDFEIPEVVVLSEFDQVPQRSLRYSKRQIFQRDHYACQYCGKQPAIVDLTVDHVVPRSQGGVTEWTNCVACCAPCNVKKADRTPEQAGMKLKRNPVEPSFVLDMVVREIVKKKPVWAKFI